MLGMSGNLDCLLVVGQPLRTYFMWENKVHQNERPGDKQGFSLLGKTDNKANFIQRYLHHEYCLSFEQEVERNTDFSTKSISKQWIKRRERSKGRRRVEKEDLVHRDGRKHLAN